MEDTLTVLQILFFASMIILAFFLIISLKKISESVNKIEKEIVQVSDGLTPLIAEASIVIKETSIVIKETSEVVKDLSVITENIKVDYVNARPALMNVIEKTKDIGQMLGKVKDGTAQVTKFLFPVLTGVSTALKVLKK